MWLVLWWSATNIHHFTSCTLWQLSSCWSFVFGVYRRSFNSIHQHQNYLSIIFRPKVEIIISWHQMERCCSDRRHSKAAYISAGRQHPSQRWPISKQNCPGFANILTILTTLGVRRLVKRHESWSSGTPWLRSPDAEPQPTLHCTALLHSGLTVNGSKITCIANMCACNKLVRATVKGIVFRLLSDCSRKLPFPHIHLNHTHFRLCFTSIRQRHLTTAAFWQMAAAVKCKRRQRSCSMHGVHRCPSITVHYTVWFKNSRRVSRMFVIGYPEASATRYSTQKKAMSYVDSVWSETTFFQLWHTVWRKGSL